jgi:hypothetical protein
MPDICVSNNLTYEKLPEHRLEYIALRIKLFIHLFRIQNNRWPLDCTKLIREMKETQIIPFFYGFFRLPEKYEAITDFKSEHNVYLMQINRNKVRYPFETSSDRRLNFTLAHEIGHIMLDHLKVPRNLKTATDIEREEHEANEFAGQLLMPEFIIYTCNFYSLERAAEYLMVSKTALWMRLNTMNRLDLLTSKRTHSCSCCGNMNFSTFAEFCGICGQPIQNELRGMRRIIYPTDIRMDRYKRVLTCPVCHTDKNIASGDRCGRCGTYIFNYCSSYFDECQEDCSFANSANSRFCEMCGKPTYYYEKNLLRAWHEAGNYGYIAKEETVYSF